MEKIYFFSDELPFTLPHKKQYRAWIRQVLKAEQIRLISLNYVFCSDDALLEINRSFLNHDYYTDIITFDHSEQKGVAEGELYISIDRVKDNGFVLNNTFGKELSRVIIHGVLHLCGYKDKTNSQKTIIRAKEDTYLALLEKSILL